MLSRSINLARSSLSSLSRGPLPAGLLSRTYKIELTYYADESVIAESAKDLTWYTIISHNNSIDQIHADIARFSFNVKNCWGNDYFDAKFLAVVFNVINFQYSSLEELIIQLQLQGLTSESINKQLHSLQNVLNISDTDFEKFIASLSDLETRKFYLTEFFNKIFGQERASLIIDLYMQDCGHGAAVMPASMSCNTLAEKYIHVSEHNTPSRSVGQLTLRFEEDSHQEIVEFNSASALELVDPENDQRRLKIPGIGVHKITLDPEKKIFVYSEYTASNYVLFNLALMPGIKLTKELLELAQAEENLRSSILLSQRLGLLAPEATDQYNVWLSYYLSNLDLRTATPAQIQATINSIKNLHAKGTATLKRQNIINPEISQFVELLASVQDCLYNFPTLGGGKMYTEFDEAWLTLNPRDCKDLTKINQLLQTKISGCEEMPSGSYVAFLMFSLKNLEGFLNHSSTVVNFKKEKIMFLEEMNALKDADMPILDKLALLNSLIMRYSEIINNKCSSNAPNATQVLDFANQTLDQLVRLFKSQTALLDEKQAKEFIDDLAKLQASLTSTCVCDYSDRLNLLSAFIMKQSGMFYSNTENRTPEIEELYNKSKQINQVNLFVLDFKKNKKNTRIAEHIHVFLSTFLLGGSRGLVAVGPVVPVTSQPQATNSTTVSTTTSCSSSSPVESTATPQPQSPTNHTK